jgi:hypothetical protein
LLEILSRAWSWTDTPPDVEPVLLGARMPDFARDFYALLPGLGERISLVNRTTRFERIIVPEPAFVLDREVHIQFKQLCDTIAAGAVGDSAERTDQPLYLSRSGLDPASSRTVLGEEQLENFLLGQGFRVVHPERLPVPEQIVLLNRHRTIVASMGSACHSRVFSIPATDLVVLCPERFNPNYLLCDLLNGGSTHYVNVLSVPDMPDAEGLPPYATPLLLDIEKTLDAMKNLGLLRTDAHFSGSRPGLEEYRERWIQIARRLSRRPNRTQLRESIGRMENSRQPGLDGRSFEA